VLPQVDSPDLGDGVQRHHQDEVLVAGCMVGLLHVPRRLPFPLLLLLPVEEDAGVIRLTGGEVKETHLSV
jgi:hypothetical protein